jgi:hypothetical protein
MPLKTPFHALALLVAVSVVGGLSGCGGGTSSPRSGKADSGLVPGKSQGEAGADLDGAAGSSAAQAVSMFVLIGGVAPCAAGYAHPSACCQRGACLEDQNAPFSACDEHSLTFPDRRTCCSLSDGKNCVAVPNADADASAEAAAPAACSLPCGPEGYPAGETQFLACSNPPSAIDCVYCCTGLGCPSDVCNCPAEPPCSCNTPSCTACPDGWQGAEGNQVDLCCRAGSTGGTECFSQSAEVRAPAEGSSMTSGPNGCDAYKSAGGHFYEVSCDVTMTPTCTCSMDGTMTQPLASGDKVGCSFSLCGFPQ